MEIETFLLERNQTLYENEVRYNLTESGVHPFTLSELLDPSQFTALASTPLGYGYTEGRPELRRAIASWYPGATATTVAVTHGASEANLLTLLTLLSPGDEIIFVLPNFMQLSGLGRAVGITVTPFELREEDEWQPDLDRLEAMTSERTRVIALANPNNPTGQVLTSQSMAGLVRIAASRGIHLLADEIYRGAEIERAETPTFFGMYDRVVVTSSLSKAFALPGLRLGWVVAPEGVIREIMRRQDYTSIGTGILSQLIAQNVLAEPTRSRVLKRTRDILRVNVGVLRKWLDATSGRYSCQLPQAGAMAFLRYDLPLDSATFSERLRREESVFVVAGSWFGLEGFIRVGIGMEKTHLEDALDKLRLFADRSHQTV